MTTRPWREIRREPATQSAAVHFERAFPGGVRAYAACSEIHGVDVTAAEKEAHQTGPSPWITMREIAAALNEEAGGEVWGTQTVKRWFTRRGLGRVSDGRYVVSMGEIRAAFGDGTPQRLRERIGDEMTKKKSETVSVPVQMVGKKSPPLKRVFEKMDLVPSIPTLDERICDLLMAHPLDAVLCGLARVHEHGHAPSWSTHRQEWIPSDPNADARAIRECLGKLSSAAGKVLKESK